MQATRIPADRQGALEELVGSLSEGLWDLSREVQRARGERPTFSPFSALGVEASEIHHSRFLAHLLDPRGPHGQGPLFLNALLDWMGEAVVREVEAVEVKREFDLGDAGRVDIAIFLGPKAILIENKVYAPERPAQIHDYRRALERQGWGCRVVFLTPEGRQPTTGPADACLSYGALGALIRSCVAAMANGTDVQLLQVTLNAYAGLCARIGEGHVMNSTDDLVEILLGAGKRDLLDRLLTLDLEEAMPEVRRRILNVLATRERRDPESTARRRTLGPMARGD